MGNKSQTYGVIGAVIGGVAGYFSGGNVWTGAQYGYMAGSALGGIKDYNSARFYGPRLNEAQVIGAAYGEPIPYAAGVVRVAGGVWWASERREIETNTRQGKGGGPTTTTYSYEIDILLGLLDNTAIGISRIWSNGKLVYSILEDASPETVTASLDSPLWSRMTFYDGNAAQLPDPTYEAAVTTADACAYRGRSTVFIEGLQLGQTGYLPNLTFEVIVDGSMGAADMGLLVQFDEAVGSNIVAALGPDPVLTGTNALDASTKKWGAKALHIVAGQPQVSTAATIVNQVDGKAWRFEFWVLWVGSTTDLATIQLADPVTGYGVEIGRRNSLGAYQYFLSSGTGASGVMGTVDQRPPTDVWAHVALEQLPGEPIKLYDSNTLGYVGDLSSIVPAFTSGAFKQLILNAPSEYYVDSMLFRWFEPDEHDLLYANGYTVPAGPFEAPPYSYELATRGTATLRAVVERLCARAQMPAGSYDASALDSVAKPVRSLLVGQVAPTRGVLQQLQSAFYFEAALSDKLYFRPRAAAPVKAIAADDLAAGPDGADEQALPITYESDLMLPAQVAVQYRNTIDDHQPGIEYSDRLMSGQVAQQVMEFGLGMTPTEAKGIADAIVVDGFAALTTGRMALAMKHAELEPSDVVTVTAPSGTAYRVRLARKTDAAGVLQYEWVLDDASVVVSAGITDEDYEEQDTVTNPSSVPTLIEPLDIPLLRDEDDGVHYLVAARGASTPWPGALVLRSNDDITFAQVADIGESAVMGYCTTTLGDWAGGVVFDEFNSLTVDVGHGELSSATRAALIEDETINAMAVGDELIRFTTATLDSSDPNVYTLTGLLRGQLGTEWAMGAHGATEPCVLLRPQGIRRVGSDVSSFNQTRYLKGVTKGASAAGVSAEAFEHTGVSSQPLAPVDVRAEVVGGSIVLTWKRRTRYASAFVGPSGSLVPLGETTEAYVVQVVLVSSGAILRTINATTPTATYTAAQQSADGVGVGTAIRFDVRQVSSAYGPGRAGSLSLTLSLSGGSPPALQPKIATITLFGTFAVGNEILVYLGGYPWLSYTTVGGDTDLDGAAASLAAVLDAQPGFSASAAGAVITVTGASGVDYPIFARRPFPPTIYGEYTLVQTGAFAQIGGPYRVDLWIMNAITGVTEPIPLGTVLTVRVERPIYTPLSTFSYTTIGVESKFSALGGLKAAFLADPVLPALGFGMNIHPDGVGGYYASLTGPPNYFGMHTEGPVGAAGFYVMSSLQSLGQEDVPADRPRIETLEFFGAVSDGWRYKITLDGVLFEYVATAGDDNDDVAAGLAALIDADADYIATSVGPELTITSAANGVNFSSSYNIEPDGVRVAVAITQEPF